MLAKKLIVSFEDATTPKNLTIRYKDEIGEFQTKVSPRFEHYDPLATNVTFTASPKLRLNS